MCSHRHAILHPPAEFRSNRTIGGGVMTSYRFFKMAVIESEMYFRVQVWWRDLFKNMEIYLPARRRWDISIHGWDKTTSGWRKRTAAILEISFRCRFWCTYSHRHVILHLPAKLRSNRTIGGGVMTSYRFFKMAAIESEMYLRFRFSNGLCLSKWKSICLPNFDEISQSMAEIKLLPVSENGRPPF